MKNFLFVIMVLPTFFACSNDDDNTCYPNELEIYNLEEIYNCPNSSDNIQILESFQDFMLIQNQSEFDNKLNTNCDFQINFETYNLLIFQILQNPNAIGLLEMCEENTFALQVEYATGEDLDFMNFYALIPKNSISTNSSFSISSYYVPN